MTDQRPRAAPGAGIKPPHCNCFLYRRFAPGETLHTVALVPLYAMEARDDDRSVDASIAGVCCFVSHQLKGFMYTMTPSATALISEYLYMRPSAAATISGFLVGALTANASACRWTAHTPAHAQHGIAPHPSLPPSLLLFLPFSFT